MPNPTQPIRLLKILISRHRKLCNLYYRPVIKNISQDIHDAEKANYYRSCVNDIIALCKELREQEMHTRSLSHDSILEEIESTEGASYREKLEMYLHGQAKATG